MTTTPTRGTPPSQVQRRAIGDARSRKALDLRLAGLSLSVIARECGYRDASGAKKAIDRVLELEYPASNAAELRAVETAHLLRLRQAVMSGVVMGSAPHIGQAVKISERIAKLHGLDAPTRVAVTSELDAEIDQLLQELAGLPPVAVDAS